MEYKTKTSPCTKQPAHPLKLTTLQNQYSKLSSKNKSISHMLFKHQIPNQRDSEEKYYQNPHNSSIQDFQLNQLREDNNQYGRLMNKFNRNRSKYQRGSGNENSKSHLNTTLLKIHHNHNDHNETLNNSFKSNDSRLKFLKKEESKSHHHHQHPITLSKCLSMNFLQGLELKNRKTPPNREPSEDCGKLRPALGPKVETELVKVLAELKEKNQLIRQLEQRQHDYIKQLSSKNKVEMEYYKLLNKNILFEEEVRTKERRAEELEKQLKLLVDKISYLESENESNEEKLKQIEKQLGKEHEQAIEEWRELNQTLSDSLIKLNQQNSLITKKLSEAESKATASTAKLIESQKLVELLKSNVEFEKNAHADLLSLHNTQSAEMNSAIKTLEKKNLSLQKSHTQLKIKNSQLTHLHSQQIAKNQLHQQQTLSLIDQIQSLHETIANNSQQTLSYKTSILSLEAKISQYQNRPEHQFTSQQESLRQNLILAKISHQQKQRKYEEIIREHKDKIIKLEDQIEEIKCVTTQSYDILNIKEQDEEDDERGEENEQERENLELQTSIVELRSRLQVFMIIEKQLRERLEMSGQRIKDMQKGWQQKVSQKQAMISILKSRNQLLQKQLQIITTINGSEEITDSKVQQYLKQQLQKISSLQEIITHLHSSNKKLQYDLADKVEFIEELKKQIDKDDETIKDFRGILEEMNKRLISHSELLEVTNKMAIMEQLRFGDYREEVGEEMRGLKEENGGLERELKGIYDKLEVLEERIGEEEESENEGEDQSGEVKSFEAEENCCQESEVDKFHQDLTFIEEKNKKLNPVTFQI